MRETTKRYRPGHVSGAGNNLVVIKEPTARQIAVVSRQFTAHSYVALTSLEAVDGTDIVESTARHEVA